MSRVDSHVAAVRRRLTLGIYIEWLAMAAFVLAVLALLVILSEKIVHIALPPRLIWVGVGAVAVSAGIMSILRAPTAEAAAVAIDERLGLKEKFSTALSVKSSSDPFARAVVLDAERTAGGVHLAGRFPLEFPRAGYWCAGAVVLALLATCMPEVDLFGRKKALQARQEQQAAIAVNEQRVREAMVRLEQLPKIVQQSERVQLAKRQLDDFLKNPTPDGDGANMRVMDAMGKADEAMRNHIAEMQKFADAQKTSQLLKSMNNPPVDAEGPVAKVARGLKDGDLQESMDELKKLSDKFQELDKKGQEDAAKQMQQLADALNAVANDPRVAQKMQDQLKQMGVNQQQIQQAQQLVQQAAQGNQQAQQQLQQMQQQMQQQLAQQMQQQGAGQQQIQQMQQQMQQAMQNAQQAANAQAQAQQMAQGAQQMAQGMQQACKNGGAQQGGQAGQQMAQGQQQMQQQLQQMQQMQQDLKNAQNAQQGLQQQMGQCNGGQCQGQGQGQWKPGDQQGGGQQPGGGGAPPGFAGDQPKNLAAFAVKKEKSPSQVDEKGQHLASVFVKDKAVNPGESRLQLAEVIKAGKANEGGDVDDSRADRRAQEVQKKYFQTIEEETKK
ncbi:MAG: hypothetical protein ABSH20_09715 [Tepidisphaeraceae bacterium]|jgi:myosin heavy subunit